MHKKIFIIAMTLLIFTGISYASDIPVKVTPNSIITTASRKSSIMEGDSVDFRVLEDAGYLKKGDIINGLVTNIEDNGFNGKAAEILIENFHYKNKKLKGYIYLKGSSHKKLAEFTEYNLSEAPSFIRGGEVIARPDECDFILYLEN